MGTLVANPVTLAEESGQQILLLPLNFLYEHGRTRG